MSRFAGKVVLITGTARGCGAVLGAAFAEAGATVVACDVDAEAGSATADTIRRAGGQICSDDARFCTGTTLVLDGGFTAQ